MENKYYGIKYDFYKVGSAVQSDNTTVGVKCT